MKLYGLRIFVDDLTAAKTFYIETMGLSLHWELPELGAFGAALDNAELIVETAQDAEGRSYVGRFVGASLQVDDIYDEYDRLKSLGVHFETEPEEQEWGGVLAHFKDPSGNTLTLLGPSRTGGTPTPM
ncbi:MULTISPECIES: VOC family protein [Pseudovibrio]|uniref:VOC family protein n=1 Tax=Stappiaceae TaxID=2821832 RepID=UPI0023665237|nr:MULTISPECIES: VOC family protein [Pseudovibrio]MDD7911869.1 VOC family protein [Pseudovibrio exalbescens]MDX5594684.1 VOC family protein [Pseudovibrio sp. SPO723]